MTWFPCCRIVQPVNGPALRLRGLAGSLLLWWPDAVLNGGADYSVDFSPLLCDGDRIVQAVFSIGTATMAWQSIFGSIATAWLSWSTTGQQRVSVTALTANGDTLQATIFVNVGIVPSPLSAPAPEYAPNALFIGAVYFPDALSAPLIAG